MSSNTKFKNYYCFGLNKIRSFFYSFGSNKKIVDGKPFFNQPTIVRGEGKIVFGADVAFGQIDSPFFLSGTSYLEARSLGSKIIFHNDVSCNNNLTIICDRTWVEIGPKVRIGTGVQIIESDFHNVDPLKRNASDYLCEPIKIGANVWIGNNTIVLKGVKIGDNCVIAAGSVVTSSFKSNHLIGGVPAKIIKSI